MKILRYPALLLLALAGACGSYGQIELQSFYKGGYYKVTSITPSYYYVDYEGKKREGDNQKLRFEVADSYAEGFVEVNFLDSGYEEKKGGKPMLGKNQYVMHATVKADRSLKNCYVVLLFSSNGSMSTFYQSIGSLGAGSEKKVKIRMPAKVDQLGSLHVFTKGNEVKSNQNTAGVSLQAEFKELSKSFQGVPLAEIYNNRQSYPHRLTSDGKYLATYRNQGSHYDLVIIDTADLSVYDRQEVGRHDERIQDPYWVDDESLLFVHDEKLKVYNLKDKAVTIERNGIHRIVSDVGDGERIVIFSGNSDRYYNYNYKTGKDESYYQVPSDTEGLLFDSNGDVRLKRDFNGGKFTYQYKENAQSGWRAIDNVNQTEGLSFSYSARTLLDQNVFLASFTHDVDNVFIYSNPDSDTTGLYPYNLKTGKLGSLIYRDKQYDLGGDNIDRTSLLFNSKRNLLGISYWKDRFVTKWFDSKFSEIQKMVDQAMPNTMNRPVDWTDDGNAMVYYSFSEKDQGSYYLLQIETGKFRKILEIQPDLKKFDLASTTSIEFESRDGNLIHGYLTLPPNAKENLPLIVHAHGGPQVRTYLEFSTINQFFATRGFAVLEVDYRGSAGYGSKHKLEGLVGNLDTLPIDDLADGALHLVSEGIVNSDQISILGSSWGGYSAYMGLIKHPDIFKCGVASAAPTDMALSLLSDGYVGNTGARAFWNRILKGADLEDGYVNRISPLFMADKMGGPVLIVHGEYDNRVTLDQAKFMAKALEKEGKEYEFVIVPRVGHWFTNSSLNHYLNNSETFIKKHLGIAGAN